jgi:radical SAM-linked protein
VKVQRLRFCYRVAEEGCGLGHRELISAWEAAAREAGLTLAYSEGKRPAPQISLGAPLPQNVTSDAELMEMYLSQRTGARRALVSIKQHLPPGIEALSVEEVGLGAPSLQSQIRWAEYEVELPPGAREEHDVQKAIGQLLDASSLPAEYRREAKVRQYDLRPLVLSLAVNGARDGSLLLRMRLRAEPENTGRADQVLRALGLPEAARIHRTALGVEELQAAVLGFRRAGQPGEG